MKYSNDLESDRDENKRSMKGFYIALALCLLAIVGVAVVTLFGDSPEMDSTPTTGTTVSTPTVGTTGRPVAGTVTGVPDDRTTTTRTTTVATATPTKEQQSLFVFPVSNVILQPFSEQLTYSQTLEEWRTHNGTDFEAKQGDDVKAVADGTVSKIYEDPLWGQVIELDHGDKLISRYCGVKAADITEGKTVTAGQVIGTATEIPAEIAQDMHIHVEILANNKYVDPMTLIRGEAIVKTTGITTTTTTN